MGISYDGNIKRILKNRNYFQNKMVHRLGFYCMMKAEVQEGA